MPRADAPPAEMLGHQSRLDTRNEIAQAVKMCFVQRAGRSEAQADAMQTERIRVPNALQVVQWLTACTEVVFAVYFKPPDARPFLQNLPIVNGAQADACRGGGSEPLQTVRRGRASGLPRWLDG